MPEPIGTKKAFKEWLEQIYPEDFKKIWDAWKDRWQGSPYYNEYVRAGLPLSPALNWLKQWQPPKISESEYIGGLTRYLNGAIARGEITAEEKTDIVTQAQMESKSGGVHSGLPYYKEVIQYSLTPDWVQFQLVKEQEAGTGRVTDFTKRLESQVKTDISTYKWAYEQQQQNRRWQYEQEQQNQRAAQEQWWRQTSILENAKQQAHERTQQRLAAIYNRGGGGEAERTQASGLWNEWRNRISAATPDWDFMKKWEVSQMEDPFAPPKLNAIEEVIKIKRETDALKIEAKTMKNEWSDLWDRATAAGEDTFQSQELMAKANALMEAKQSIDASVPYLELQMKQKQSSPEYKEALLRATPQQDAMGNWSIKGEDEVVKPKGPKAPDWLSKYVPEYPAGTEITKPYKVAPASLQTLGTAMPSELQGLQSYLGWAGQKPEDWIAETGLRQTVTPNIANRWSPASQRA